MGKIFTDKTMTLAAIALRHPRAIPRYPPDSARGTCPQRTTHGVRCPSSKAKVKTPSSRVCLALVLRSSGIGIGHLQLWRCIGFLSANPIQLLAQAQELNGEKDDTNGSSSKPSSLLTCFQLSVKAHALFAILPRSHALHPVHRPRATHARSCPGRTTAP
jgi:hypothetical protein